MSNFLADYVFYNSGNECPQVYHIWSGLAVLSTVISRKVWIDRDYFFIYPNIYVVLVGDAGSGKGTARDCAVYKLLLELFPNLPMSASVTSREDVAKFMASEDGLRTLRMPDGSIQEYRPFFFSVAELSNLLSVDMRKMVDFLVDLYDSRYFSTSFKRDEVKDKVPNPCATMLACCVPDWIMRTLKMDLFTGGLGRRLVIVYENRTILKAHPRVPQGGREAWERVRSHIMALNEITGPVTMSPACDEWWVKWYENYERLKADDPLMRQILANKHVMLQKIALLVLFSEQPFKMVLEPNHMIAALALLDNLEPAIKKLSMGIGRNELAAVSVEMLDTLNILNGFCTDRELRQRFFRDCRLNGKEYEALVEHLCKTGQLVMADINGEKGMVRMVFTPEAWERLKKQNNW